MFLIENQEANLVERNVYFDFSTEEGSKIMSLSENQVDLKLEFARDQRKIDATNMTW